ncbi:MAG: hypothetical protein IJL45_05610 [Prevotella sp.]|nr:hypothetical protein [Prevotella sp.]
MPPTDLEEFFEEVVDRETVLISLARASSYLATNAVHLGIDLGDVEVLAEPYLYLAKILSIRPDDDI